jgi:hypothetical protein
MIETLIRKFKRLRELEERLEHLQKHLSMDGQWMHHDPTVRCLTERYAQMASENWRKIAFTDVSRLRQELDLCPWTNPTGLKRPQPPKEGE